ncbi:MAG: 1-phosphofructokinase [Lachnospiraceae bacterium]|nr:1-phosphofructokinase [Lachnospiraceae bacterium]MBQ6354449.1 1-phosphofructokinase [Lachnospiraceae bacterium]MBR2752113.1 1-phosphofructokinase [Lachnospiraceae bacterium]
MIYTVTFNPAIDYVVYMDGLEVGETNRTIREEYYFGGKGINVSWILNELGVDTTALGFISGFTGAAIENGLLHRGIRTAFIELDGSEGITRINMKIKSKEGEGLKETEINGQGPKITKEALDLLFARIDTLGPDDMLVISGSVPSSMPADTYEQILSRLSDGDGTRIPVVVDAIKDLLLKSLPYKPFLIKPNNGELEELLGKPMRTTEEIIEGAKELRKRGARNVIVSRGGDGSVMVTENDEVYVEGPSPGKVINTVGAGDSMVAGFITGYINKHDYQYALKLGAAAGSATACSPGLGTREEIERRMEL